MNFVSPQQYAMTLYIAPDNGPVSPMKLDMLSVETAVMGLDASSDRDEARVRLIAERIKAAFPEVDPYGNLHMIAQFISRLSHIARFSGVVLRLPGTINGPAQPVNPAAEEFARLADEYRKLKEERDDLRTAHDDLKVQVGSQIPFLEQELKKWIGASKKQEEKIQQFRHEKEEAQQKLLEIDTEYEAYKARLLALEKENTTLRSQEEQHRHASQKLPKLQGDIAALRLANANQEAENRQLNETLEKYKQEVVRLKQESARLKLENEDLRNAAGNQSSGPGRFASSGGSPRQPFPPGGNAGYQPYQPGNGAGHPGDNDPAGYRPGNGAAKPADNDPPGYQSFQPGRPANPPLPPAGHLPSNADEMKREWLDGPAD